MMASTKQLILLSSAGGLSRAIAAMNADAYSRGGRVWYNGAASTLPGFAFTDSAGTTQAAAADVLGMWISREQPVLLGASIIGSGLGPNDVAYWVPAGANTKAQNGNYVDITYVNTTAPTYCYFRAASGTADLNINVPYLVTFEVKVNTGTAAVQIFPAGGSTIAFTATTTYTTKTAVFSSTTAATSYIQFGVGVGQTASIRILSLNRLLASTATQATAASKPTLTTQANGTVAPVYDEVNDSMSFALASAGSPDVVTFTDTGEITGYDSATATALVLGQTKLLGKKAYLVLAHATAIDTALLARARTAASLLAGRAYP